MTSSSTSSEVVEARRDHLPFISGALKPGVPLFNQEAADAVFGLRPHHRHVRDGAVGDPHLGAIDAPLAARLAHGLGEHPAGIGPEIRFGQAEASDLFTLGHLGEPVLFLGFAAIGVDGPHHETALHRREGAKARIAAFQLVHQQTVGHAGKTRAAVFLGQRGAIESQLAHLGDEVVWESLVLGMLLDDGQHFAIDEVAGRFADHAFFVREQALEAHEISHVGEGGVGAGHENSCALKPRALSHQVDGGRLEIGALRQRAPG